MNATHLAEHGRSRSTFVLRYDDRWVVCCVPNYGHQELVGAFGRAVLEARHLRQGREQKRATA